MIIAKRKHISQRQWQEIFHETNRYVINIKKNDSREEEKNCLCRNRIENMKGKNDDGMKSI